MTAWAGVMVPAGVTRAIIARLNAEINKTLASRAVREKLHAHGLEIVGDTPAQFAEHVRKEAAKWADVVTRADIKVD